MRLGDLRRLVYLSAHLCTLGPPWHLRRAVAEVSAVAWAEDGFEFARVEHALCAHHQASVTAIEILVPHAARIEYEDGVLAE